jgi:tetratricopeptide (TPR) repeat protein
MWPFEDESTDPDELAVYRRAVDDLRHEPDGPQTERQWADLGRQLNRLASLLGPVAPSESVEAFREAAEIWEQLGRPKAKMVSQMRLAVALARANNAESGLDLIESLIDRALANPAYRPYFDSLALHRAAIYAAMGDRERARDDLDRVAEVRAQRKPGSEDEIVRWLNELVS